MSSVAPSAVHRPSVRAAVLAALLALLLPALAVSGASPARASSCNANSGAGAYGGGNGSAATPYLICSADHIAHLAATSGDWGEEFLQTADITMPAPSGTPAVNHTPIGTGSSSSFTGVYDGGGFEIRNLSIASPSDDAGLFGEIAGATLKNIRLVNVNITADGSGYLYVGGLVGEADGGSISDSSVSGIVSNTSGGSTGGLVGYVSDPTDIVGSSSTAAVSGTDNVGGLVGDGDARIADSFARGGVTGTGDAVGGLIGALSQNGAEIVDSFATGRVEGRDSVGGLVGSAINGNLRIIRSSATGAVHGRDRVGGLVGRADELCFTPSICISFTLLIEDSFATGSVTGDTNVDCLVGAADAFTTIVDSDCREAAPDAPVSGAVTSASASFFAPGGVSPSVSPGLGEWVQADGSSAPLAVSSPGVNQVRYSADGIQVTFTGGAGSDASRGLVANPAGEVVCEVCVELAAGGVIEAWMFSTPRLVAAWRIEDLPCQTFAIPVVAPLDGGGPISAGAHTLQLALPTASGMQAVNVGVTVGGPVPGSVPAGEGPAVPAGLLLAGIAAAAFGLRRLAVGTVG